MNAGCRMLERLRADYPRMAAIIVAGPSRLRAARFSFLLAGDHKSLYQDIDGLRRGNLLDRLRSRRHEYEWVTVCP